ncbi:UNVERIFIED_CONTAM: hypothetical protein K2H54_062685 [Gekko kuhli]
MTSEAATRAWVTDHMRQCSSHRSPEDKVYSLGQRLAAVEQTQQQMMQEFKEVILAIPDMVIQALRAKRKVQQPVPAILPLQTARFHVAKEHGKCFRDKQSHTSAPKEKPPVQIKVTESIAQFLHVEKKS